MMTKAPGNVESTEAGQVSPRRVPAQQRSRDRLDKILAVASALIAEKGSDQVKMSEVADLAGISIGSLYQYFPDKRSIIRTLAERYNAESRSYIAEALAGVTDAASLRAAYIGLIDVYYALFVAEPVRRDIWSGMQADKELMALQLNESRICGGLLADAIQRADPRSNPATNFASAFLIWELGEAAMRMAILLDRTEGDAVVAAFKRMTVREIVS